MYIEVEFGYKQSRLFNINCLTAPLIDAVNERSIKDMQSLLKQKEDGFKKDIAALAKREAAIVKRLEKLEPEEPRDKGPPPPIGGKKPVKKKGKAGAKGAPAESEKKEEEAETKKEEEKKEEPKKEDKKKEEEKKKKDDKKKPAATKKGGATEEEPKEAEETPEEKLERERGEARVLLEEVKQKIGKYQDKIKMIHQEATKLKEKLASQARIIDLSDPNGERKFLKTKADLYAKEFLLEKGKYTLIEVTHNPENQEEIVDNVVLKGECCRTLEEDWAYAEQAKDEDAGKKKGAGGKKK